MRVTFVVAMTLLFAFAASPDSAQGSFPGENGRFVLTWDFDAEGVGTDFLATTDKTGGDFRVLRGCSYECHHRSGDWSPNGRRLVYVNECPDCRNRLVIVRPNGSYPRVVYRAREYPLSSPVWSPDGRRIAFVEYLWSNRVGDWVSDVYIIQRDGTRLTRVTHTPRKDEYDLDWSSRNRLVFVRSCAACLKGELFTMRPNGLALRQLTDNDVADIQPEWSPGGGRLTFVRRWGEIWRMGAWGANASRIASGHSPAWAPDGSLIAFVAAADGAIHTVKPSGEDDILLGTPVQEGSIHELDWQPR
jgi:Tol biopolymer transport system component